MTSPSGSLRDLYSSPRTSWSFGPSSSNSSPSSSSAVPKHEWTTRPTINPIFDLAPSLQFDQDSLYVETRVIIKDVVASALVHYASTALVMPWEAGKLLLQIQWVPREPEELQTDVRRVMEEDELSDESSDETYFQDPTMSSHSKYPSPKPRLSDEEGYIVRRSVLEEGTRPDYVMPIGKIDGVWGMIKKIVRCRDEGWLALWKGLLTSCVTNALSSSIQPFIHNILLSVFSPSPTSTTPAFLFQLTSHLITGVLLSPLDLVRTRLIAQSSIPLHRTYTGPLDALSQLLHHEGGFRGLYLHPHLLIPAVLDNTARPLVMLALPSFIAMRFGLNQGTHWFLWSMSELTAGCLGAFVTIPIETVRRRLQVQTRGTGKFKACVETRPRPYHGVVDVIWRILTEERSDGPRLAKGKGKGKAKEEVGDDEDQGWLQGMGVGQLFRGLGMSISATVVVTILAIVTGTEEPDTGWTEL